MEYLFLGMLIGSTIFLLAISLKSNSGLRFILLILAGYWIISFLIRPSLFLFARDFDINNVLYDSRIGKNENDFNSILARIVLGNFVFCATVSFLLLKFKKMPKRICKIREKVAETRLLILSLTVGLSSSLLELTSLQNPITKSLSSLASFCFCAYIWNRDSYQLSRGKELLLVSATLTVLLSVAGTTGHFKGVLLTPVVVFFARYLTRLSYRNIVGRLLILSSLLFTLIPFFTYLQEKRLGSAAVDRFLNESEKFPWFLSPFTNLAIRFDQFARVTDAYYAGEGILGGYGEWLHHVLVSLEWNPSSGRNSISFGQQWNQQVTYASVPGSRLSSVSLAQGMIGEGWIWNGFISLILECLLMGALFYFVGQLLEGRTTAVITAFGVIGNSTIFEAGTVQVATSVSGAIKNLLFLIILKKLFLGTKHN